MFELDADSQLERKGDTSFRSIVTDRWSIGSAPNGGYLAFIALQAALETTPHVDPFSVTTHYLSTARPGEVTLSVESVRTGRGHSTREVRMHQGGKEILRQLAVLGDLSSVDGPTELTIAAPPLPPMDQCDRGRAGPTTALAIADRIDVGMKPGAVSWTPGPTGEMRTRSEHAELTAWLALKDGRAPDAASLVFFADALPPPILNYASVVTPWVPTLELTVHVRARPSPGRLRVRFSTCALIHGYLEEDGEIWDAEGKLVAMSRQLARVHRA
jgi:acyl-CoA thioesterase